MGGCGSAETSDGRASPDGFIRLIRAEIWMAHPRGPKEMNFEVSARTKRINRLYGPYTRETSSSDYYGVLAIYTSPSQRLVQQHVYCAYI
jgi:hypothetical protein